MATRSIQIIRLEYNDGARMFHFAFLDEPKYKGWVSLADEMDGYDAEAFFQFMDRKYVRNKAAGQLPSISIVRLELELFVKLKSVRRKLVNQ